MEAYVLGVGTLLPKAIKCNDDDLGRNGDEFLGRLAGLVGASGLLAIYLAIVEKGTFDNIRQASAILESLKFCQLDQFGFHGPYKDTCGLAGPALDFNICNDTEHGIDGVDLTDMVS